MDGFEELEQEILSAKADTLGRLGEALETALGRLTALDDAEHGAAGRSMTGAGERDRVVARAAEALLFYVVQREAMGLRADPELLDELGVPLEVRRRMGLDPYRGRS